MTGKQLSLFDILEDKKDSVDFTLPKLWTLEQLCEKYYQFKLSDGCSISFLDSARRHLKYFMDWLRSKGFNPGKKKLSNLNSAILSDFRQMLANKYTISRSTANLYISHVRLLLLWSENIHGLSHPPMGVIR